MPSTARTFDATRAVFCGGSAALSDVEAAAGAVTRTLVAMTTKKDCAKNRSRRVVESNLKRKSLK